MTHSGTMKPLRGVRHRLGVQDQSVGVGVGMGGVGGGKKKKKKEEGAGVKAVK